MQVTDTLGSLCLCLGLRNRGQQKGSEDSDDGDDDQKFDQGKGQRARADRVSLAALSLGVHILIPEPGLIASWSRTSDYTDLDIIPFWGDIQTPACR